MEATKQAQVRGLTRDVGALREALHQEEKKRERVAAAAKAAEEARAAAESQLKQQRYVNTKLEQELRTVRERADTAAAKDRAGAESLRERLADVERGMLSRSVEAHRHVQRLHSLVQDLQATAMPLAVAAAASPAHPSALPPALKSPLPGRGRQAAAAAQHAALQPQQLHRQFAQVLGGLSQLAALFSGGTPNDTSSPAVANPAPLLLGDGGARAVRWHDQNTASNQSSPASSASLGGCSSAGGGTGGQPPEGDADKARLAVEVHRLRTALAEARQRAAASEAAAAAAAAPASASDPASSGRVAAAMRQLDAVVPQYRAAVQALQSQLEALKAKLTAAVRERAALADEVAKWRGAAQRHEAAYAEAAAKLHTWEAQSLAKSTQCQSETSRLQGDADALRRRCSELAGRLQEAQRAVAQLQASLAAKEKLAGAQQATIHQLEGTIREQQADIRSALALVSGRPAAVAAKDLLAEEGAIRDGGYSWGGWEDEAASAAAAAAHLPEPAGLAYGDDGGNAFDYWGSCGGGGSELGGSGDAELERLLGAATAAADAASAWAGGFEAGPWPDSSGSPANSDGGDIASWIIPAVGGAAAGVWLPGGSTHSSPLRCAAAPVSPAKQRAVQAAGRSLQSSPKTAAAAAAAGVSLGDDIAGLESALRAALRAL